jgi:hypothetical protein
VRESFADVLPESERVAIELAHFGGYTYREVALGPDRTYQLWGVIGDQVISLGVLGARPGVEPFTVDGDLTALVA